MVICTKTEENSITIVSDNEDDFLFIQRLLYKAKKYDSDAAYRIVPFEFSLDNQTKTIIIRSQFCTSTAKNLFTIEALLKANGVVVRPMAEEQAEPEKFRIINNHPYIKF
jgi:hypothetical protein